MTFFWVLCCSWRVEQCYSAPHVKTACLQLPSQAEPACLWLGLLVHQTAVHAPAHPQLQLPCNQFVGMSYGTTVCALSHLPSSWQDRPQLLAHCSDCTLPPAFPGKHLLRKWQPSHPDTPVRQLLASLPQDLVVCACVVWHGVHAFVPPCVKWLVCDIHPCVHGLHTTSTEQWKVSRVGKHTRSTYLRAECP